MGTFKAVDSKEELKELKLKIKELKKVHNAINMIVGDDIVLDHMAGLLDRLNVFTGKKQRKPKDHTTSDCKHPAYYVLGANTVYGVCKFCRLNVPASEVAIK